jgi:two-component system response regulator YesN
MYKVLIIDDEQEIRQGLRLKIDWQSLGFQIAGEASNGKEALDCLAHEAIDVVLTDMNMPAMDGMAFLDACREQYPTLRTIVITGYEDFHYAKSAVRNHARDYLLKPVARDELANAVTKVKQELDNERRSQDQESVTRWRLSQYYKEMKEHYIVQLVKEQPELDSFMRHRSRLFELDSWHTREVRFIAAGLRPKLASDGEEARTPDKFRLPFDILCREIADQFEGHVHAFRDALYPGFMFFVVSAEEGVLASISQALRDNVAAFMDFEIKLGEGQPVTGFESWKSGFLSALAAWNMPDTIKQLDAKSASGQSLLSENTVKLIERYVVRGEMETFKREVGRELEEAFRSSQPAFVKTVFQLYLMLEPIAGEAGLSLEADEQLWLRPDMVLSLDTPDKALRFLSRIADKVIRLSADESGAEETRFIEAACHFIEENYMYDLNLTMIAEKFNYNPSYFSEMFKNKVGKTFIQYLNETRMAHAVRLLEDTALGLWDIAELTGFSNASYFSSRFKRMFGTSPSEYRQRKTASVKIDSDIPNK